MKEKLFEASAWAAMALAVASGLFISESFALPFFVGSMAYLTLYLVISGRRERRRNAAAAVRDDSKLSKGL